MMYLEKLYLQLKITHHSVVKPIKVNLAIEEKNK